MVPRIVADAKRPFVRKLPFAEPQSCWTGFWFAASVRGAVHTEKSPPTRVNSVRLPSTSTRNRAGRPLDAPRTLSSRNSVDEKLPKAPSKPVNVITPFVTSTMSPTLRMNTSSAGWTIPLTSTVPVPTALNVLGVVDAGGGGGVVVAETTLVDAEAVLFDVLGSLSDCADDVTPSWRAVWLVKTIVSVADPPEPSVPTMHVADDPRSQLFPFDIDADSSFAPSGTGVRTTTPVAVSGPLFVTSALNVMGLPTRP